MCVCVLFGLCGFVLRGLRVWGFYGLVVSVVLGLQGLRVNGVGL